MDRYVWIVMGLNFVVDLLLLAAVFQLTGAPFAAVRCGLGAMLGGLYGGVCLLPSFHFLGNGAWQLACMALISLIAFGFEHDTLRKGLLFCLLRLALNSLASVANDKTWTWILCGAVLFLLFIMGVDAGDGKAYVPMVIHYAGKTVRFTAFRDTGNFLKDPVTGKPVVIADPVAARELLGLTLEQLEKPAETMVSTGLRGLRLIPYSAIGNSGGLLLAMRFADVELDGQRTERIVAFAPQLIGSGRGFQALVGGMA